MQRLLQLDKFLNRLTGGSWESTISARIGYYSLYGKGFNKYYWIVLSKLVDFAFYPLDGRYHCYHAFNMDAGSIYKKGTFADRLGLGFIVLTTALPIFIICSLGLFLHANFQRTYALKRDRGLLKLRGKSSA